MSAKSHFTVSPGELGDLAGAYASLLEELIEATADVGGGAAGAGGAPELEAAIGAFTRNWSDGLTGLHGSLRQLQQNLAAAMDSYLTAEGDVSRSFGQ